MKIAQVAPLWERVPPITYGGIELVVSLLTDELVRRGHQVVLFASGDSETRAELQFVHPQAIRLDDSVENYEVYEMMMLSRVYEQADNFDIIHSHVGFPSLSCAGLVNTPTVHTLHGNFDRDRRKIFDQEKHQPFISISNAQRNYKPDLNYIATVYNAINLEEHQFHPEPKNPPYFAFLGRMCKEKGPHYAIEIAKRTGTQLKMAGKIDDYQEDYYEREIEPLIDGELIQFLGEVNHEEKNELLGGAIAMLFPITWDEPFGLVMAESMAAGTPVIAMRRGSTPEVIADGKTGFLCDAVDECCEKVSQISQIDRNACRQHVEENFSVASMVNGYEAAYHQVLSKK